MAYYKLLIAKLKREQYGRSAERGRKLLDQLELQLEELEASAAEDEATAATPASNANVVRGFTRKKPVRAPVAGASATRARGRSRRRPPARAAVASWPNSARRSPRPWRWCRASGR